MKNLLHTSTLSIILMSALLTACGNSEEVPSNIPAQTASTPVNNQPTNTEEKEVMLSNDEIDKLISEFETEEKAKKQPPVKPVITQMDKTVSIVKNSSQDEVEASTTSSADQEKQEPQPDEAASTGKVQQLLLICNIIDQTEFSKRRSNGLPGVGFVGLSPTEFTQNFDKGVAEANAMYNERVAEMNAMHNERKDKEKEDCKDVRADYVRLTQIAEGYNKMAEDLKKQGGEEVSPE